MKLFHSILNEKELKNIGFTGLTDELFSVFLKETLDVKNKSILVVTPTLFEANKLYEFLLDYTKEVYLFPMDDFLTSEAVAISPAGLIATASLVKKSSIGKRYTSFV